MQCSAFFCIYCKDGSCLFSNPVVMPNGECRQIKSLILTSLFPPQPVIHLCGQHSEKEDKAENIIEIEKREEFFNNLLDKLYDEEKFLKALNKQYAPRGNS